MSHTYEFPRPALTVDCVVFGFEGAGLQMLLIRRGIEPFKGAWALPGGFVHMDESLEAAARRELMETFPNNTIDVMWDAYWSQITGSDDSADQLSVPNFVADTTPPRSQIVTGTADPNDGRGYTPPKYLDDPIHPNALGHGRLGVALAAWIAAKGW